MEITNEQLIEFSVPIEAEVDFNQSENAARQNVAAHVGPLSVDKLKTRFQKLRETVRDDLSLHIRGAQASDIAELVEVDLETFDTVYKGERKAVVDTEEKTKPPKNKEELRAELTEKFEGRFEKLGGKWIKVLEKKDDNNEPKILGCVMACPTSRRPEDFVSWEDNTDNGTLEKTYDPNGDCIYVVSLGVKPEAIALGGNDMLIAHMIGKFTSGNYLAYFESRVPGFRRYVLSQCRKSGVRIDSLTTDTLDEYSLQYFATEVEIGGKKVPLDPQLRMYKEQGCSPLRIVPNAYQDWLSMNYGAVCQVDNPLPPFMSRNPILRRVGGEALSLVARSNYLLQKAL